MKWYVVNEKYTNILRDKFKRDIGRNVPLLTYNKINSNGIEEVVNKPLFGVCFEIDDIKFFTTVYHYDDSKHSRMNESPIFIKLYDEFDKPKAVVYLSEMFPVNKEDLTEVTFNNVDILRNFTSNKQRRDYWYLLEIELEALKRVNIQKKAVELYNLVCKVPMSYSAKSSLPFDEMKEFCIKYKSK